METAKALSVGFKPGIRRFIGSEIAGLWEASRLLAGKKVIYFSGRFFVNVNGLRKTDPITVGAAGDRERGALSVEYLPLGNEIRLKGDAWGEPTRVFAELRRQREFDGVHSITFPAKAGRVRDFFRYILRSGLSVHEAAELSGSRIDKLLIKGEKPIAVFDRRFSEAALVSERDSDAVGKIVKSCTQGILTHRVSCEVEVLIGNRA